MRRATRVFGARRVRRWTVALAVAVLVAPGHLAAQEFHADLDAPRTVRFISHAPIQDFDGVTDRIDGYAVLDAPTLDGARGGEGTEFYFEVDLASLDTGLGLRNRHMRDNYLEVKTHPYATFEGAIPEIRALQGAGYRITAEGTFTVHGVSRELSIPCDATPEGEGYRIRCGFGVLLSDFDIEIPKVMFLKLANEIELELDFALRPAS